MENHGNPTSRLSRPKLQTHCLISPKPTLRRHFPKPPAHESTKICKNSRKFSCTNLLIVRRSAGQKMAASHKSQVTSQSFDHSARSLRSSNSEQLKYHQSLWPKQVAPKPPQSSTPQQRRPALIRCFKRLIRENVTNFWRIKTVNIHSSWISWFGTVM